MKQIGPSFFRMLSGWGLGLAGLMIGQGMVEGDTTVSLRLIPQLTLTGKVGSTNAIQYVDALKSTNNWIPLTNFVLKTATAVFYDADAPASEKRFYRVIDLGGGSDTNEPAGAPENLVWISPNTFTMGSPETDLDRTDFEIPQHAVTFTYGFWIGKYEVTQGQFEKITGFNPSYSTDNPLFPVDTVTWHDATNYCGLLTAQELKAGTLPSGYGYRLPSEAEWECAARAGKTTRFSYGDDEAYAGLDNYAWSTHNSDNSPHPVGQKSPNAWGIYDLYGNVAEWCLDWFDAYAADSVVNPFGPATGNDRVYRGGSCANDPMDCRAAARGGLAPDSAISSFGFRVVLAPIR